MRHLFTARNHREELHFYIGQVAEITGASRKDIRHYESLGLLPPAVRRGQYRVYSERDIFLVHMIKHAQSYGFSLAELTGLVTAKAVDRILHTSTVEKPRAKAEFVVGDQVRGVNGPLTDFTGEVSEVNIEQSKLKVMVSIFGRDTPTELGFEQVKKI